MADRAELGERRFDGVWIPREIWLSSELSAIEKVVLTEIRSLDGKNGCFASNEYIAEFCQCSTRTVSRAISHLVSLGYIETRMVGGRTRIIKTLYDSVSRHPRQNGEGATPNCPPSNIVIKEEERDISGEVELGAWEDSQVDSSSTYNSLVSIGFVPPTADDVQAYADEFCSMQGLPHVDAHAFYDHYAAQGWVMGNNIPMHDWKAAVRKWATNNRNRVASAKAQDYSKYDASNWERG